MKKLRGLVLTASAGIALTLTFATSLLIDRVNWKAVRERAPRGLDASHSDRAGAGRRLMLTAVSLAAGAVLAYVFDPLNGRSRRSLMRAGLDRSYMRMRAQLDKVRSLRRPGSRATDSPEIGEDVAHGNGISGLAVPPVAADA